MDITSLSAVSSNYLNTFAKREGLVEPEEETFSSLLDAAMKSLDETNTLQNNADGEKIRFALGESENTHDLFAAMAKASVALQYTTAVRDRLVEGYNQIMQMQI